MVKRITKVKESYKHYMEYDVQKEGMKVREDYYYNKHPDQVDFIVDFFKVKRGIRPRGAQYYAKDKETKEWRKVYLYHNPITDQFNIGENGYGYPFTDINSVNVEWEIIIFNNLYFFPYIYSKKARKLEDKGEALDYAIGITPIMDIDSISIDPNDISKGRYDVLGTSKMSRRSYDQIEKFRLLAREELENIGIWKDTRLMHSGNGLYIILPDFYGDLEEINRYSMIFNGLKAYLNSQFGEEVTHETKLYSKQLFKIPFTFHNTFDRVSIPINKDNPFAYEIDTTGW